MDENLNIITLRIREIAKEKNINYCLTVLNSKGELLHFSRSDEITPCSIELSQKKAFTAYYFQGNTEEIFSSISEIGHQPLISDKYCFLPGGAICTANKNKKYYIGISTNKLSLDSYIAIELSNTMEKH